MLLLTLTPSKLNRTFGPSRTSMRRPEPYSISCLPTLTLIHVRSFPVPTSKNAACVNCHVDQRGKPSADT